MTEDTDMARAQLAIAVVALAVIAALAGHCAGKSPSPAAASPQDPYAACADFDARALAVWNPQICDGMDFSVLIFKGDILASEAELAVKRLDEFTKAWVEASAEACRAHADAGTLESDEYRAMTTCLGRALESQGSIIASIKTSGRIAIARAQTLPEALKRCKGEPLDENAAAEMRGNPFGGN